MILVSALDVAMPDPATEHRILILVDEGEHRLLAIWTGPYDADSIALKLQGKQLVRPMTYSFIADLLDKAGVQIESVAISALEKDTFFATVHARSGRDVFAIDARPSDAIALALYTDSPIFVAEEVMDAAAEGIPDNMEVAARGKGLDAFFRVDPEEKERRLKERERRQSKAPKERREENRRKLLAYLTEVGSLSQRAAPADE